MVDDKMVEVEWKSHKLMRRGSLSTSTFEPTRLDHIAAQLICTHSRFSRLSIANDNTVFLC